jgi:SAM-dependent methyltransferase
MLRDRMHPDSRYLGFDVDEACIRWCRAHLRDAQFDFVHHDYWNGTFRPGGERFKSWPVEAGADVILLKSLFTHMLPADVEFYIAEIKRVLASDGTALVTAFTYEAVDGPVETRFRHGGDGYRYARSGAPESAVAYPRKWLLDVFADHGLATEFHAGFWRPQASRTLAFQDVIIVRHRPDRVSEPAPGR